MKVLVIGGGGREDALVWKILQSPLVKQVFCAPGNGGIAERGAICLPIEAGNIDELLKFAAKKKIDLTVVGPEKPLVRGIVDLFEVHNLPIVGCSYRAAEIEGSKVSAKESMQNYGIPTAPFRVFYKIQEALTYIHAHGLPIVIKADGLCGGKGVKVCITEDEAIDFLFNLMSLKIHGDAGKRVVIEDCLDGEEASYIVLTDGKVIIPLASSQDHKTIFDGDEGENTGGMGAYSPAPVVTKEVEEKIINQIIRPLLDGMAEDGRPYQGFLYVGLMIKDGEPKVLEFNARLGDPETQPVLMRMKSDIVPILAACAERNLSGQKIEWDDLAAVCVVMSAMGYPGIPNKWDFIRGLYGALLTGHVEIFHAGTFMVSSDEFWTNGGRVLGVTGKGDDIPHAIRRTYEAVKMIYWPGVHYRKDIGQKALKWLKK